MLTKILNRQVKLLHGSSLRMFSNLKQSKYENYTDTSKYYDSVRVPCGVNLVIDRLKTPQDALVLDAGAGSGNYTFEICKNVKQVVSFEVNEGMIS